MNTHYEYIRLKVDFGDLEELNRFGSVGWRVVHVQPLSGGTNNWVLLERALATG